MSLEGFKRFILKNNSNETWNIYIYNYSSDHQYFPSMCDIETQLYILMRLLLRIVLPGIM